MIKYSELIFRGYSLSSVGKNQICLDIVENDVSPVMMVSWICFLIFSCANLINIWRFWKHWSRWTSLRNMVQTRHQISYFYFKFQIDRRVLKQIVIENPIKKIVLFWSTLPRTRLELKLDQVNHLPRIKIMTRVLSELYRISIEVD